MAGRLFQCGVIGSVSDKWNQIYQAENAFQVERCSKENNGQIYKSLPEQRAEGAPDSLDACVIYAIANGCHAAFARWFRKHAGNSDKDRQKLAKEIDDGLLALRKQKITPRILNPAKGLWQSPEFEYPEQESELDRKVCVSSAAISHWRSGEDVPKREALLQLGFYFGIDSREMDRLLLLAGHPRLYVLDVIDAVCIFYLNYYAKQDTGNPYDKISKVKHWINQGIKQCSRREDKILFQKAEGLPPRLLSRERLLQYREGQGWNIEQEIKEERCRLEQQESRQEVRDTDYLTQVYTDSFQTVSQDETDFQNYLMNNGQSFHVARYGYLLETARFLEDVEAYRKNFRVFDYPLIYDGRMKREDFLRDSEETNRTLAWLSEKSGQSGTNRESCYIQMLNYNWGLYSGLRDAGEKYDYRGKKNKVSMMIYGRNKKDDPVPKISGTTSLLRQENLDYETGEAKQDAYEFNLTGRKTIFRFALAAGHEDDVEDYLRLAGYASGEEQTERREWYTDEAVVEYAKRYRDALVEKWAQEWSQADGVDITQLQEEIRSRFPFIRLVATINRDVELVMRYDREWQGKRPMSEKEMEKEIQQYCNDMVYPIYDINAVWFDWYREHIKWT